MNIQEHPAKTPRAVMDEIPHDVQLSLDSWGRTISQARSENIPGILRDAAKELFPLVRHLNAKMPRPTLHQSVGDALYLMGANAGIEADEIQKLIGEGKAAQRDTQLPAGDHSAARRVANIRPPLTISEWRERELAEPDFLMGNWLTTTSRVLLTAATGLGKTNFGIALGMRVAAGDGFLHWNGRRAARVLYIDGEMSNRLLRERVVDEAERFGKEPATFFALSHEDIPSFRPLNTPEGQAWLIAFIKYLGGVDLVIFDNIMCLTVGDMKDPEAWQKTLPLALALTAGAVGQIWIHHTGHDETRSYGDKSREWQTDTVAHLDEAKRPDTDVSFSMSFKKARERKPTTRFDFQDVRIALVDDRWEHEVSETRRPTPISPQTTKALEALTNVVASGQVVSLQGGRRAVKTADWKAECVLLGLIDTEANAHSARTLFAKFRRELVAANRIACEGEFSWLRR
ncbi:MAG: hypothetical protein E8A46_11695 [Bradyrhizobium sp.]|jgi:hypothetical protein|uniref:AAA family ATPase n=1 Tax=Bradyrhizobium sp. TaxID=376 RepID=UPI0012107239|nr:AAA family ATPase [Bradyrhizobium sp.]THD53031.1 MAG: hypothetical protein E8A46_11695 [Bradyrhizobium sp.]